MASTVSVDPATSPPSQRTAPGRSQGGARTEAAPAQSSAGRAVASSFVGTAIECFEFFI